MVGTRRGKTSVCVFYLFGPAYAVLSKILRFLMQGALSNQCGTPT